MNDFMLDEIIRDIHDDNDSIQEKKDSNLNLIIESIDNNITNDTFSDILLKLFSEKRLNNLLTRKLVYLETVVKKKREEREVKNYFLQHYSKDIYLKNQVIYSTFHQVPIVVTDINKKTKTTRNNKKCK